jgi:ribosomal protein L10
MKKNQKEKLVNDLAAKFSAAKVIYLTDFTGLTVAALSDLRRQLKKESFNFKVIKNTLIVIAAERAGYQNLVKDIAGPTGVTMGTDPVMPAKIITKFAKENGLPKIKVGVVDGKIVSANDIIKLSKLPSREVLLTQLVVTLNGPMRGLVVSLNDMLGKLVRVVNAIAEEKKKTA